MLTRCLPRGIHGTRFIVLTLTTTVAEGWLTDVVYPPSPPLSSVRRAHHPVIQTRNTLITGGDIHMATVSVRYIVNDIDAAIGFYQAPGVQRATASQ